MSPRNKTRHEKAALKKKEKDNPPQAILDNEANH